MKSEARTVSSVAAGRAATVSSLIACNESLPGNGTGGAGGVNGQAGSPGITTSCGTAILKTDAECTNASDGATCSAAGGVWTEILYQGQPLSGEYHCVCPSGDEGCPCTTASDCRGFCIYSNDGSLDLDACNANPIGKCGRFGGGCLLLVDGACNVLCE
jgi:hypothetical protein